MSRANAEAASPPPETELPLGSKIIPAAREEPSAELLKTLRQAGLSDSWLDAAGGKGTARQLRDERENEERKAVRSLWRRHRESLMRDLLPVVVGIVVCVVLEPEVGLGLALVIAVVLGFALRATLSKLPALSKVSRRR